MKPLETARVAVLTAVAFAIAGCGQSIPYMQNGGPLEYAKGTGAGKIKHIVYIVQENRSFDNMFYGYPGADTATEGKVSNGQEVKLVPVKLNAYYEIDHSLDAFISACDGTGKLRGTKCRNDAFDKEFAGGPRGVKYPQYVYVPHDESLPYFDMAKEGVLADHMFQSQLDESFVGHQYIIAGQAAWSVNLPDNYWGCQGGRNDKVETITPERTYGGWETACFNYTTLGDELDKAHLTWRFYASRYGSASSGTGGTWSSYQAIRHIYYGPDWKKDVISPNWKFITDVRAGKLADFTWITPVCADSDHVNCPDGYGPSWVAALVNTVGESKFWDSTAIFIQWDDWGGLYDHVPPPPPYYRDSLGFRVPLVIVSPYAKRGTVSHTQYETSSVLKFAENLWGLSPMADGDTRAASPADSFDFSQKPLGFIRIPAPHPPSFFMRPLDGDYFAPDYE